MSTASRRRRLVNVQRPSVSRYAEKSLAYRIRAVSPERHVERASAIEAAETVETRSVEEVEETSRFGTVAALRRDERVETVAVTGSRTSSRFCHRELDAEAALQPPIEIDQMWVDVIEERSLGGEAQRHPQTAAEGLDEAAVPMSFPRARRYVAPASACRRPT